MNRIVIFIAFISFIFLSGCTDPRAQALAACDVEYAKLPTQPEAFSGGQFLVACMQAKNFKVAYFDVPRCDYNRWECFYEDTFFNRTKNWMRDRWNDIFS